MQNLYLQWRIKYVFNSNTRYIPAMVRIMEESGSEKTSLFYWAFNMPALDNILSLYRYEHPTWSYNLQVIFSDNQCKKPMSEFWLTPSCKIKSTEKHYFNSKYPHDIVNDSIPIVQLLKDKSNVNVTASHINKSLSFLFQYTCIILFCFNPGNRSFSPLYLEYTRPPQDQALYMYNST